MSTISTTEYVTVVETVDEQTTISIVEESVTISEQVLGIAGPKGDTGDQGPQGPQGIQGATGATGATGAKGDTGATGATGAQGPSGVISVTSPITNTGTSTAAQLGIDQTLLAIAPSQVTGTAVITTDFRLSDQRTPLDNSVTSAKIVDNTITGTDIDTTTTVRVAGLGIGIAAPATGISLASGSKLITRASASLPNMQLVSTGGGDPSSPSGGDLWVVGTSSQSLRFHASTNGIRTIAYADGFNMGGANISNVTHINVTTTVVPLLVRGAASQTADLQQWQNSASTVLGFVTAAGTFRMTVVQGGSGAQTDLRAENSGGKLTMVRATAAVTNPGANYASLYFRDGTTAGTLKLVVRAGAAGAETTILDNIPQ